MAGDPELAAQMRELGVRAPIEKIVETDWVTTALANPPLKPPIRVAVLACGHRAVTRNRGRVACKACHKMILNGEDYDAFRNAR